MPTASEERAWLGEDGWTPQASVIVDREWAGGDVHVAANLGVRHRTGDATFTDDAATRMMDLGMPSTGETIAVGSTIPFGAGIAYALAPGRFDLIAELFGEVPLDGENFFPLEALGGVKLYLARNSFLTLGGGVGLLDSIGGNPDVRAFMGIVFEPNIGDRDGDGLKDDVDHCPDDPEDFDDFEDRDGCPELDNDRDTILDTDDRCPNQPEDKDGVEDDDGCPETDRVDRDGDRIVDELDACPDDPEDYDDWEDGDGCPDLDNDHDKILDVDDLCPDRPEDDDDWEDEDGCPDPDNDRDRILDTDDDCPNEPENLNGYLDKDGCPDRDPVKDVGGELVVFDKIHFEYNKAIIKEESHAILDAVGFTIVNNPDIKRVEVQGHTDERGSDRYNLELSQRRAEAVVKYLEGYGIDASRLRPKGYGEREPIDESHNEEAWAVNRRVEFLIRDRD
jgi:outer membrane protein OmpA-like peptidoglycan-associated protein